MRGKTAKQLRQAARLMHATLTATKQIDPPKDRNELRLQRRKLYQLLKRRWKKLSQPKSLDLEMSYMGSVMRSATSSSDNPK